MKILVNPKNLVPDETWQTFRKVRAILENEQGCTAITVEGGKCIFPGGKCEKDENELTAIQREIKEETGILFDLTDFIEVLQLETIYDDFYDFRSQSIKPRHTITTYYYVKTDKNIEYEKINLTDGEKKNLFQIRFVDRTHLNEMLMEDHSNQENGKFFDEENQIVLSKVINKNI